jgi:hypothetical protein
VGDGERQRAVGEEPVELAACGIEGSLLIFAAVIENGLAHWHGQMIE